MVGEAGHALPLVEARDLRKIYAMGDQKVVALDGVSVAIHAGEFVAVMGPSGSGKSTFMNMLGCLDTPTSGSLLIEGRDTGTLDADELADLRGRRLGFVFQQFNLLARTTALDNVILPLRYDRSELLTAEERVERARDCLRQVNLQQREDHHPTQLSGGQQQRVAIARALVNRPALVLADEPTGALDTRTGLEIMALFQNLNRQGITIVLVTHESDIAASAKRILTFRDGHLVSDEKNSQQLDAEVELSKLEAAA